MSAPDVGQTAYGLINAEDVHNQQSWYSSFIDTKTEGLRTVRERGGRLAVVQVVGWITPPEGAPVYTPAPKTAQERVAPPKAATAPPTQEKPASASADARNDPSKAEPSASEVGGFADDADMAAPPPANGETEHTPSADLFGAHRWMTGEGEAPKRPSKLEPPQFLNHEESDYQNLAHAIMGVTGDGRLMARRAPKHPAIRGVDFPPYCDVIAATGPDGPITAEQLGLMAVGFSAIGGKMDATVGAWVGCRAEELNAATAEAVLAVLNNLKR